MGDHDQRHTFHLPDADIAVLAVVLTVVKPSQNGSLEDALGGFKPDPVLSDVGLILGCVPFKHYLIIINIIYNYNRVKSIHGAIVRRKDMSELGPDYLPEMREALSRFCNEIRSFHADHGNDLTPGSPAVHEKAVSPRPESLVTAWCQAAQLIESGSEHVTAFVKTITEPMELIACWTCVRSMLESCALASWLLDPRINGLVPE